MSGSSTIQDRMQSAGGVMTGFDYLRIGLSLAVLGWHSIGLSTGSVELDAALWSGPFRFLPSAIIPVFFALSGFLVAGSLERNRLHQFITLRFMRLIPALAVEIALSALFLGLIFTTLPKLEYLSSTQLYAYFLNIIGDIHFELPGVFKDNPFPGFVNGQLWTIPFELECYLALILLSVSTLLKRRLAFVSVVVCLALALTARILILLCHKLRDACLALAARTARQRSGECAGDGDAHGGDRCCYVALRSDRERRAVCSLRIG